MGYWIGTSGRVVLPEHDEARALALARERMLRATGSGWLTPDEPVSTLDDLARFAGTTVEREGDVLVFAVDEEGDPKWSDQATAFWTALGEVATAGRVEIEGEDGARWSYDFTPGGLVQRGVNGWDGTGMPDDPDDATAAEGSPATAPAPAPAAAVEERRRRGRRYLVCGAIPAVFGAGTLAVGDSSGRLPLLLGTVNLAIAWRLLRR